MATVGYFLWTRNWRGGFFPRKYCAEMARPQNKDTSNYYTASTASPPIALDEEQWALSLDDLAKKYPAPVVIVVEKRGSESPP